MLRRRCTLCRLQYRQRHHTLRLKYEALHNLAPILVAPRHFMIVCRKMRTYERHYFIRRALYERGHRDTHANGTLVAHDRAEARAHKGRAHLLDTLRRTGPAARGPRSMTGFATRAGRGLVA